MEDLLDEWAIFCINFDVMNGHDIQHVFDITQSILASTPTHSAHVKLISLIKKCCHQMVLLHKQQAYIDDMGNHFIFTKNLMNLCASLNFTYEDNEDFINYIALICDNNINMIFTYIKDSFFKMIDAVFMKRQYSEKQEILVLLIIVSNQPVLVNRNYSLILTNHVKFINIGDNFKKCKSFGSVAISVHISQ